MIQSGRQGGRHPASRIMPRGLLCSASLVAVLATGVPLSVHAEERHWDANGTGVGSGGDGTWNLASLNWSPNGDGVSGPYVDPWDNAALDDAVFGGTAGTVTLGAPITVHDITFNTNGYVLDSGTLTLGGSTPTISVTTGTTRINSVVAGASGLVKTGGGALQLYGANSFSGDIALLAGSLYAATDGALGAASNMISTAAGADVTLRIDGAGTARSITIGDGGTLRVSGAGIGSALISGNGRVYVGASNNNVSIVRLTNDANSYTGATIFNGCNGVCSAYFSSIADLGVASSLGAPTTVSDGTIIFNQSSQYSDSLIYIGDGDSSNRNWDLNSSGAIIRNQGTGTLILTGDIDISSAGSFNAESADYELLGVLSGGSYSFNAYAGRTITLGAANTFTGTAGVSGLVQASVLADIGTASSLGTGTNINVNAGTLSYTGSGASSDRTWTINAASSILNNGSGALDLSGDLSFSTSSPNPDNLTLGGSFSGVNSVSGVISGNGNLVSDGAGTWVLSGANTYTGTVTVDNGILRAGNASAFGNTTGFTVNGGTLDLNGHDLTTPSLGGTGGEIALGSGTLTVLAKTAQNYAGGITGSGGLTKSGAGTLTLTGASTYSGATTINGGTLRLDFSGAGGSADNIISASSPLVLSGGAIEVQGADGETNGQSFNGLTVSAGSNTVRAVSGTGGGVDVSLGAISRTGGLVNFVLPDAGAITTSNADGALGGWATINGSDYAKVVSGGIVAFDATDYTNKDDAGTWQDNEIVSDTAGDPDTAFFGTVGSHIFLGGLRYTAAADSTVTIAGSSVLGVDGTIIVAPSVGDADQTITGGFLSSGLGGGTLGVQQNGAGLFTIASQIADNAGVTSFAKGGTGTVALAGSNSYTGSTTLTEGILRANTISNGGVTSSIGASTADASNLVIEGGTFQYTGGTATTDRGFTLVNGSASRTIEVTNTAANLTFAGQVTSPDDAGFTKTGAGTLTLANAGNDYVGVTTVSGGTLAAATLADGGLASSIGAASGDSANIVLAGGALAYTGTTTSTDRGMTLGTGGGTIGVTDAGTVLTVSGILTGTSLSKTGDGTLILSGANTYTGNTIVNGGTLQAGSTTAFGSTSSFITVNSGGTLDLGGFDIVAAGLTGGGTVVLGDRTLTTNGGSAIFTGTITGTGGYTRTGSYTQTFSGCGNSYTGVTTLAGRLSVDCLADGGVNSGIGASGSDAANLALQGGALAYTGGTVAIDRGFTLVSGTSSIDVVNAATTLTITGAILGTGALQKDGAGTLVLAGTNGNANVTRVAEGTLRAGADNVLGRGALSIFNSATALLELDGHDNIVSYITGGGTTGGRIDLGGATLTVSTGYNSSADFAGIIEGSGSLIKNGSSYQALSGCDNSYDGATIINGGTFAVTCLGDGGADSSIGSSSAAAGNLVLNGGTLRYVGAGDSTDRRFTLGATSSRIEGSGTGAIVFTDDSALTFLTPNSAQTLTLGGTNTDDNILAAQITNNGTGITRLTKTDAGTWILTNPNSSYTGITTISGGVLGVDKLADGGLASSIGASSAAASNLVIGNGSTLRYTGTGDTTNRLFTLSSGVTYIESSGTGAIMFTDTGTVTLANNNQARTIALGGTNTDNNTLAGSIGNAGTGVTTLAKNDSGTWVLTGNHSYTGSTNVNGGILFIGDGGTTGSIVSATVNDFGTLGFDRSDTLTYAGNIVGTGSVLQQGTGKTILTGTSSYSGGTTISAGTLQLGNGGTTGSIVGDVANDGTFTFDRSNGYTFGGVISGSGIVSQIGTGTTVLTGINSYSGGTLIDAGTLQISADANLGAASGDVTFDGGTLRTTASLTSGRDMTLTGAGAILTDTGTTFDLGGTISGAGAFTKAGAGTLVVTADSDYTGGTTIGAGTLQLGDGGTGGWIEGDVANNGTLTFDRSDNKTFAGLVSGTGGLIQNGSGIVTLTADNSYAGATVLNAGTLRINGDQSAATGLTTVNNGATLGGSGLIGGSVVVNNGGVLAPGNSPGTLTIAGNLSLSSGSVLDFEFGEANVVGGALNDLVEVGGDLVLDGAINVTVPTGGSFDGGIYRVFNYDGTLTDNGLDLGTMPTGSSVTVQTSVAGQVNLVNATGLELSFWDGDAGPKVNSVVDGGAGTWHLGGTDNNWTDASGGINAAYADGTFAIFAGIGDVVTVDNGDGVVTASGMQFASDGYTITGDALTLTDPQSVIRVGDGTAAGAGFTTVISAGLTGTAGVAKTDLGTLILTGANSYTGGTLIDAGTLQIGDGGTTGSILGDVGNNGTLAFNRSDDVTFAGLISGSGDVVKQGGGILTLTADNSYTGGTTIAAGTLQLGAGGWILGDVANEGMLVFNRSGDGALDGLISGSGAVMQNGAGVVTLTGDNSYAGATDVNAGTLLVNGDQSLATGLTSVASGATLGGAGIIGGDVTVAGGGSVNPGLADATPAVLTINGDLSLAGGATLNFDFGQANVVGGALNDLIEVGGDLVLAGTLNVDTSSGGSFDPGIYRVINYNGTLTDNGLAIGSIPSGTDFYVQTSVANQVNLINTDGLALRFWDGAAGIRNDGVITGGDGIWQNVSGNDNWTLDDGSVNAPFLDSAFAVFQGVGGTVTVDDGLGAVNAAGMQFASDDYVVEGDGIALVAAQSVIRVGDGTAAGAGYTATIASALTAAGDLVKSDLGTLVLTGANSVTDDLYARGGELRLAGGGTLGSFNGVIGVDAGEQALVTVTGSDGTGGASIWTIGSELAVGYNGNGALTIAAGGKVASDTGVIGLDTDGVGQVLVTGAGSSWENSGRINVGLYGTGGLRIEDGASVSSNDGVVGGTGPGEVVVSGPDSRWTNAQQLTIGSFGAGTMRIEDGASVTSNQGYIGANADGSVVVTGAGSNWSVTTYSMTVGNVGTGSLTVADGGLVHAEGGVLLGVGAGSGGTVILQGTAGNEGVLETSQIGGGAGAISFSMDGGLLRATQDVDNFFTDFDAHDLVLGANGGIVDTDGHDIGISPRFTGSGGLAKAGAGVLTLTGDNGYTGGTTIAAGTLQLGDGGTSGSILGDVVNDGTLALNRSDDVTFAGLISGTGGVAQNGVGVVTLTGANSYAGATDVNAGTLLVNGDQSAATGLTSVASGASLGGTGIIGGDVAIADGATLTPGAGGAGALGINGDLTLAAGAILDYQFGRASAPGDALNDVVNIGGNLVLDGTINVDVTPGGSFDVGLYRVANYSGTLTDNGLGIGTLPTGANVQVQTSVANQVNLVNLGSATLNFWDGAAGPKFDGAVNGGDGVWQNGTGNDNWTETTGAVNAAYEDGAFAIFSATSGTVGIDNSLGAVSASGMQFASDGYVITGDALTLTGPQSIVRVGDGTSAGADFTATIEAALAGDSQLVKTDAGTLVLNGTNSYSGGTLLNAGTLQISGDANLGDASADLGIAGGTLHTTADIVSGRAVDLAGAGTLLTDGGTALTLNGLVSGTGSLAKSGAGTLMLTADNSYAGATAVEAGTLFIMGDQSLASGLTSVASGATLGGTGTIGGDVTLADGATLAPGAGAVGTLTINGNLALASGSRLAFEFGEANAVGGALNDLVAVGGDLTLDGTIDVTVPAGGAFDAGVYRVFDYGGTLTDNGLALGTMPAGSDTIVQTSVAGQVNLVNSAGLTLNFWDGTDGIRNNGAIEGGDGLWQNSAGDDSWTEATGAVNAAYADGAFAIFSGTGGTVTVDNSLGAVTASGMQFAADGYAVGGDELTLVGAQSVIRVGDGSTAGADMTATIGAVLTGDAQLVKTDAGTLVLAGANSYTGGTAVQGGTLAVSADANLGDAAGNVTLDGGTLRTTADLASGRSVTLAGDGTILTDADTRFTLNGGLSGAGVLTKAGAGTLVLTGDNAGYTAGGLVTGGTLAVDGIFGGNVDVASGGRLEGNGAVAAIANAGVVAPGRGIGTLTVAGDYVGTGGTLEIEAVLGDDGSATDRLVIGGGTSGTTRVTVINRDGLGAPTVEGIRIIDVAGASDGSFVLNGDYMFQGEQAVIAGAYGYRLYKNGVADPQDGDWYLRSSLLNPPVDPVDPVDPEEPGEPGGPDEPEQPQPLYQPGVPVYEGYAQTLQALNGLPTLQQRVGNRAWANVAMPSDMGIWGRMDASRQRPEALVSTSGADQNIDSWQMQMGLDAVLGQRGDGATLIGGITAHYGKADNNVASIFGNGRIDTRGYGLGATLTWYGPEGFYADAQAKFSWFDSDLKSDTLGTLVKGNDGRGQAFSLEVGKRSPIGGKLTLTPQLQMTYAHVGFDRFVDPAGADISRARGDSLKSRWGLSIDHQDGWGSGEDSRRSHVYALVNLGYEWLDGTQADVSGTPIASRNRRLWGELGVGGSYSWGNGRYTLYTEVSGDTPIADFGKGYSLKGNAGFRVRF